MAYQRTHNLFGSSFCGVVARQYWADLALWELFLNAHQDIKTIIELGAFHGGMTLFLACQARARDLGFYSLDRDWPGAAMDTPLAVALDLKDVFTLGDFWEDRKAGAIAERPLLLVQTPALKPLLLFVDGGCKRDEFKAFVPQLEPGDYVGVHDYKTEFRPEDVEPVLHLLEPVFWDECLAPPQPCLTRFWRRV